MVARSVNLEPSSLPATNPIAQMIHVIDAIIAAQTMAPMTSYSDMVNPTDRASIDVATPCASNAVAPRVTGSESVSSMPSWTILPPMNRRRNNATHGTDWFRTSNASTAVTTMNHPISGITPWNAANVPEINATFDFLISGSLSPLATDTENASMASPMPNRILVITKDMPISMILTFNPCTILPGP